MVFVNLSDAEREAQGLGPRTRPDDPAYFLLTDGHTSSTTVYDENCYICRDPEFAQMGLPLCRECKFCKAEGKGLGHVPADDSGCTVCHREEQEPDV